MKRYYDKHKNCLVYIGNKSDEQYWDSHWDKNTIEKLYPKFVSPFDFVINTSKKYLTEGSRILEGGCGVGQQVFKLQNAGFDAIGIDYAPKTIETVKKAMPQLNIRLGDVRKLDFENNYFDAYWSFGVIEHFYNGYHQIANEMQRVIKPEGYLLITFPHMSKLRKRKARKNKYPIWKENENDLKNFYQFALDEKKVIQHFEKIGFKLIKQQHLTGLKGLKDEISFMKKTLQKIFDSQSFVGMGLAKIISVLFNPFTSHSVLLILKKIK